MKRFCNPYQPTISCLWIHQFLWLFHYFDNWFYQYKPPAEFVYPNPHESLELGRPTVTWVNHSTFFITCNKVAFLTDPIWSQRCSPFRFFGPKRRHPPPFSLESLGKIDFIIISHNHYDHLDQSTVKAFTHLYPEIRWIVPLGLKKWFEKNLSVDPQKIIELKWWESTLVKMDDQKIHFTAVPAQHFSGRTLFDRCRTLWMGCVVEISAGEKGSKTFYFAGDTGYNPFDFKKIGERFASIDLSLLPIGAYLPRSLMKAVHISPKEAVVIHQEIHSKLSIGGHWKTFRLSQDLPSLAPYELYQTLLSNQIQTQQFRVLEPGQQINW